MWLPSWPRVSRSARPVLLVWTACSIGSAARRLAVESSAQGSGSVRCSRRCMTTTPDEHFVRAHVRLIGRVQGVGFRYTTADEARRHRLAGWVRNLDSGAVE